MAARDGDMCAEAGIRGDELCICSPEPFVFRFLCVIRTGRLQSEIDGRDSVFRDESTQLVIVSVEDDRSLWISLFFPVWDLKS